MDRLFASPGRSAVHSTNAAAATSHPLATQTAISILKDGGNAVDAAIAAVATLCVVEPHMTGIGGDCFALVHAADGKVHGLNGSGRAAMGLNPDFYLGKRRTENWTRIPEGSAHSVTAPGAIRAWETLLNRFGTRGFDQLFQDAVRYGEAGYAIQPRVGRDWKQLEAKLLLDEGARKHLLVDGKAPETGSVHRQPALAQTLKTLAKNGADAFYKGEIADEIEQVLQARGGYLSTDDLAGVTADWVEPVSSSFMGHDVHEIPPNGQGITTLVLLGLLERLGLPDDPDSLERYHLALECGRLAYAVRNEHIADADHMKTGIDAILSAQHLDALAAMASREKTMKDFRLPEPQQSDTVYLSVVDETGLGVSLINSTFAGFGSGIVTPESGIALQNRGCGFVIEPGHPNMIAPGKRPLHTIIPAMVTRDGALAMSFGVMGGQYQPMGQAHVLANMLAYGMDPQQALDHPRIFWRDDGVVEAENGISDAIRTGLEQLGHKLAKPDQDIIHGGGQVVARNEMHGTLVAGSDTRKDGCAAGI